MANYNFISEEFIREIINSAKLQEETDSDAYSKSRQGKRDFGAQMDKILASKKRKEEKEREAKKARVRDQIAQGNKEYYASRKSNANESLDEYEVARDRDGAYYDDEGNKLDSKSWKGGYAKKHVVSNHPQDRPNTTPHSVHINGKKWKTFGSKSHAQNVAKKIKGATVHMEEYNED